MEIENVDDYLEHYGKKGMKWGVRNRSVTSAGFTQKRIAGGYKSSKTGKAVSRNTVATQKNLDKLKVVASGKSNKTLKRGIARGIASGVSIQNLIEGKGNVEKAAQIQVNKGAAFQKKSNAGEAKLRSAMLKYTMGINVSELNYEV
jgi:hypothetical protein